MASVQRQNQIIMPVWEYKVISSGKGGFASPALLEKFLGELGRDEWEIIHYQTAPDNPFAFTGLARRSTQRDWTLQDAAAAAAKAEAEKLRAEFEAKFKSAASSAPMAGAAEEKPASFLEEKSAPDDGFRKPVDTSRDDDPDAEDEPKDDWDKLTAAESDELPTFFDAIKPHLRRNQRGPGMSVGVEYLAKKWDQAEDDLKGALVECGFVLPEDEDSKPVHLEYDGDLYWLNINRRGELWINTKEKPRPVFRAVQGQRVEQPAEEAKPAMESAPGEQSMQPAEAKPHFEPKSRRPDRPERPPEAAAPATPGEPLPASPALLDKIRPQMRRNRRGPGGSGSTSFLSRALRCSEADLMTAFAALGLTLPAQPTDKPIFIEVGNELWWLNQDSRGGVWINGREKKAGETAGSAKESEPRLDAAPAPAPAPVSSETLPPATTTTVPVEPASVPVVSDTPASTPPSPSPLAAVRLLLQPTRTGGVAGKLERVAGEVGKSPEDLLATLTGAGLKVPEKSREKPVFVEHAGEIFWLNRNAKDELWLNAKASKFAEKRDDAAGEHDGGEGTDKKPSRRGGGGRSRKKSE